MKVEIRADGLHISGYVNVPGRESRPVITSRGKVIETIEQRAFQRAIEKAESIPMTLDHDPNRVLAQTKDKTLTLYENEIGLRAEAVIDDEEVINGAKQGKLKGWSFGMKKIVDSIEERADNLPLRRVKEFVLDHITLVMNKRPVYASTSIELRADEDEEMEVRAADGEIKTVDLSLKDKVDLSEYRNRINKFKVGK
jgi:HK97 family phage prohead protease